jgi:hypothetical protein
MTVMRDKVAWLRDVQVGTSRGDNARRVRVLSSGPENGAMHANLLVTDTSSVVLPVNTDVLRSRLATRIEEIDAQLAAVSQIDRLSLRLERDRLVRRLQLGLEHYLNEPTCSPT